MQYTGGRSGRVKDPAEPKRPLSGYFMFLADFRIKHKNDEIQNKELLKMGKNWTLVVAYKIEKHSL